MTVALVNSYNKQAYFYADSSFYLGDISKQPNDAVLVTVDYRSVIPAIDIGNVIFSVDIGSNPPLLITTAIVTNGNVLTFIMSQGLPGTTYNLTILSTRSDVLTIDVPLEEQCLSIGTVVNQAPVYGIDNVIFVNSSPKYNIGSITPSGASIMDQWYNTATNVLSEFVTDGTRTWWQPL